MRQGGMGMVIHGRALLAVDCGYILTAGGSAEEALHWRDESAWRLASCGCSPLLCLAGGSAEEAVA